MHRDLIDHFYEIHSGGEKMQCPFCLKIVAFANHGKKISANVNFFLNHIQVGKFVHAFQNLTFDPSFIMFTITFVLY